MIRNEEWSAMRRLLLTRGAAGGSLKEYEVEGNPAVFQTNVAKPLTGFTIPFLPVQSGTGDPSPQNQRPIIGRQGLTANRAGVNVLQGMEFGQIDTSTGQDDPTVTTSLKRTIGYIPVIPGGKCTVSGCADDGNFRVFRYGANKEYLRNSNVAASSGVAVVSVDSDAHYIRFHGLVARFGTDMQAEVGDTPSPYAEYTGASYPVTFPDGQTVYGGTLDAVTGVLSVEWAKVDLGTLSWIKDGTRFYTGYLSNVIKRGASARRLVMYCSALFCVSDGRQTSQVPNYSIYEGGNGNVFVHDSDYSDKDTFKEAMSGVILCYPLATPYEIQLDPITVQTLIGDNTIWTDTNGVNAVKYKKKG